MTIPSKIPILSDFSLHQKLVLQLCTNKTLPLSFYLLSCSYSNTTISWLLLFLRTLPSLFYFRWNLFLKHNISSVTSSNGCFFLIYPVSLRTKLKDGVLLASPCGFQSLTTHPPNQSHQSCKRNLNLINQPCLTSLSVTSWPQSYYPPQLLPLIILNSETLVMNHTAWFFPPLNSFPPWHPTNQSHYHGHVLSRLFLEAQF